MIFLVALGIHSVFEGIAVGLQTEKDKVLEFSVAVLVHETVMAFTFGMEVSGARRWEVSELMDLPHFDSLIDGWVDYIDGWVIN